MDEAEALTRRALAAVFGVVTTSVFFLWNDQKVKRERGPNIRNQTNVKLPNNQDVVINVTQTDAGVSAATSLPHQAPLNAQRTGASDIENPQSLSPADDQEVVINVMSGAVRDQIDVDVSHTTPISAQATRSLSPFEVVNDGNAVVSDPSRVDMSDTASLLHQDPTPAEAICSFGIEDPRNLLPQGDQIFYGGPSQSVPVLDALTPPPVPVPEAEEPNLKIELKVATWVTIISAGAIVSTISGVIGNDKALFTRKLLFKGFMSLNYIALVSGIGLFILIKISPNIPGFVRIVKITMWIAIGSLAYSLGMATCIIFPAKVEVVLILVVPFVMVCFLGILTFARREDAQAQAQAH